MQLSERERVEHKDRCRCKIMSPPTTIVPCCPALVGSLEMRVPTMVEIGLGLVLLARISKSKVPGIVAFYRAVVDSIKST